MVLYPLPKSKTSSQLKTAALEVLWDHARGEKFKKIQNVFSVVSNFGSTNKMLETNACITVITVSLWKFLEVFEN